VFDRYSDALSGLPGLSLIPEPALSRSNRWLTAILVDPAAAGTSNLQIMEALAAENIESRPVWKPMHLQPVFSGAKYCPHEGRDVSGGLFKTGLCLPSGSNLTVEDQERVIDTVKRQFN
jgi:pyridoxal phosphate-dependent aminotransferase EpsN